MRLALSLELHRFVQPEAEECFRGHAHVLALVEHLDAGSPRTAHQHTDGRALRAARDRADDGAERSPATDGLGGPLVLANARAAVFLQVRSAQEVAPAVDGYRLHVEHDVRAAGRATRRHLPHDEYRMGP